MPAAVMDEITSLLHSGLSARPHPLFAGAAAALDDGTTVNVVSCGRAYGYADADGTPLGEAEQTPVNDETLFDLASLTKLFTAAVIAELAERNLLALDAPVGRYLQSYAGGGRAGVTIRQLLSHTSGLPAEICYWKDFADPDSRRRAVLNQPLEAAPGSRFCYSCVGYLTLGLLAEVVTGDPLDVLVDDLVSGPLGLECTGYLPLRKVPPTRIAATEMRRIDWTSLHQPDLVDARGVVHDENAASLDGVAGNAGIFAPVRDLVVFGRAFLNALAADGRGPALSSKVVRQLIAPQLPAGLAVDFQCGLGPRIDDTAFMGRLAGWGQAYGHTGFTGTSLVIDARRGLVLSLVTNRVHPNRAWSELNPFRRQLSDLVAARWNLR